VAEKLIPKALLNISPVVTGCACEESRDFPQCVGELLPAENTTASMPTVESGK
jgi:hypothetical protein